MESDQTPSRAEAMKALLAEHANSGISLAAFARSHGIREGTLYYWSRRLRSHSPAGKPGPRLAPVKLIPDRPDSPVLEIELRSGHTLRLFSGLDKTELTNLLSVLASC